MIKKQTAEILNVSTNFLTSFDRQDPLNPENTVKGLINRKKGPFGGTLVITHVNGIETEPQYIYGTPKLLYPYKDNGSTEFIDFKGSNAKHYVMHTKYNGVNILMYKYKDSNGNEFITAKTKGTPFVTNSEVGNFLDLYKEATSKLEDQEAFAFLIRNGNIQSISLELYGQKEPHLVKYEEELKLAPLFSTTYEGQIRPWKVDVMHPFTTSEALGTIILYDQFLSEASNRRFREKNGLTIKYEYNHFATEGSVLYLLDKDGFLINRAMYKVKPASVEEVHWATFEKDVEPRVIEAIKKIQMNEEDINAETLQSELDMGPKEWDKFGRKVMAYVQDYNPKTNEVMVLVGLPGSGKSTKAYELEKQGWVRISQDDLGSRNACKKHMVEALRNNKSIVIDRCNFNQLQRKTWVDLAKSFRAAKISCMVFKTEVQDCIDRVMAREGHPTLGKHLGINQIISVVENFNKEMQYPELEEGFTEIWHQTN